MKIIVNDYDASEVIKIIREWSNLNQTEFGKTINRGRDSINNIENNRNRMYLNDFINMCKIHGITITLNKNNKSK